MQQNRVDSISNNLANMNTNGYKRDRAVFSVYRPEDKRYPQNFIRESHYNKTINTAVLLHENSANFEMGHIKETGNKFDFAIQHENAFFAIDTPLVDKTGTIYANGIAGDQLMIVEFDDVRQLQKVGRNQFAAVDIEPTDADNAGVKQGYIEEANVDPIAEMVRMIEASRGYEMYAKVVQTHDEISQKAASQILTQ